jgi:hypothetical protein
MKKISSIVLSITLGICCSLVISACIKKNNVEIVHF